MSVERNVAIARKLFEGIGSGEDPGEIAAACAPDLVFEIQGDDGVLPWIGRKTGRAALADFVRDVRELTRPLALDVEDVLASERRAAVVGSLRTEILATGNVTAGQFAIVLTIDDGTITRFQMLEDSFDVSKAARR